MLEKFNKFCAEIEKRIIKEQAEAEFSNAKELLNSLTEKESFEEFKKDKVLIMKIKKTKESIVDEALDAYYDSSLENGEQNKEMNKIYHYIKEF